MNEAEFWFRLEFRLCAEFAGLSERRWQHYWCDGFVPRVYELGGEEPRISGNLWIADERSMWNWEFALFLPGNWETPEEIPWAELLPADGVTGWMSFDEGRRYLEIDPQVAVPDQVPLKFRRG